MKPHKHAELIKAWADGAEIEYLTFGSSDTWKPITKGWSWDNELVAVYRIKPEEPRLRSMYLYYTKLDAKMWIDENPPEKFIYNNLYTYVGRIEVFR